MKETKGNIRKTRSFHFLKGDRKRHGFLAQKVSLLKKKKKFWNWKKDWWTDKRIKLPIFSRSQKRAFGWMRRNERKDGGEEVKGKIFPKTFETLFQLSTLYPTPYPYPAPFSPFYPLCSYFIPLLQFSAFLFSSVSSSLILSLHSFHFTSLFPFSSFSSISFPIIKTKILKLKKQIKLKLKEKVIQECFRSEKTFFFSLDSFFILYSFCFFFLSAFLFSSKHFFIFFFFAEFSTF